jgi:stage II sporulation protein D
VVRVALATAAEHATVSATGEWRLYDRGGRSVLLRGSGSDSWTIERRGTQLRAVGADGSASASRDGPLVARTVGRGALLRWNGKRYRGELRITVARNGLLVVNRLPVEDYLRGVVPLEIGPRTASEHAAVEAQAVAARSYTYTRLDATRDYDVVSTVNDQVYGGADAERDLSDAAVRATRGAMLMFGGHVVSAPYHSTCGGSTAEAPEVWRTGGEPYLRRVSDRIPDTDRYYCDPSPTFRWSRTFSSATLDAALERYLRSYAPIAAGGIGAVQLVTVRDTTPSGRVATLDIRTDRASYTLRGNDTRYVLRAPGGEILNSTYFTVEPVIGRDGRLAQLVVRGAGNGHGVGMCQWGAIGRARAGQDYRTILQTYYPGTTIGQVD